MNTLETVYREGRLIRHNWTREQDGREFLCLLTALAGDPNVRPETCPASVAPAWLAHLLPWIDDAGSEERWPEHIERLIPLADRLHTLGRRAELRCKLIAVRKANNISPHDSIGRVAALLERAIAGDEPTDKEWTNAAVLASAAAREAAGAGASWAAWAAGAAAWPAEAAAEASGAAARAARESAAARWEAGAAAAAARTAARTAAADDMIAQMIDVFEDELK